MRDPLVALAKSDPSPVVRSQLACSARRLPATDALPILRELMLRDEDAGDRYIPLLIWWAIERQVSTSPEGAGEVVGLFDAPGAWKAEIAQKTDPRSRG